MDIKKVLLWIGLAFVALNVVGYMTQPDHGRGAHGSSKLYQSMNRLDGKE